MDVVAIMKDEMGTDELPGEQEYDPRERAAARPTLEVHGIRGGFTAEGAKTVIPAEAPAKVSLRLPPDLTPAEVFPWLQQRVAELTPRGVTITVHKIHGGDAVLVPIDNVYIRAAERALEDEWGTPPVFERSGGSIPVGALFDSELHAPVIFIGTGLPDDNIHAPNEKYSNSTSTASPARPFASSTSSAATPPSSARPTLQAKTTRKSSAKAMATA